LEIRICILIEKGTFEKQLNVSFDDVFETFLSQMELAYKLQIIFSSNLEF
jgi:hypothetical protein